MGELRRRVKSKGGERRKEGAERQSTQLWIITAGSQEREREKDRQRDKLIIIIFSMLVGIIIIIMAINITVTRVTTTGRNQEVYVSSGPMRLSQLWTIMRHMCLCVLECFVHDKEI